MKNTLESLFAAFVPVFAVALAASAAGDTITMKIEFGGFQGDAISVTGSSVVQNGSDATLYTVDYGDTVTISAVPSATGTFRKWYGDVPAGCDRESATLTFAATNNIDWLYGRIVHPWTLAEDKTYMTDGNFKVIVAVGDETRHELTVGGAQTHDYLLAETNTSVSVGVIDLGGAITLDGDEAPWTITAFKAQKTSMSLPVALDGIVHTVITPGTVTTQFDAQLFHRGDSDKNNDNMIYGAKYKTIILDEPNIASGTMFKDFFFGNQTGLVNLILELSNAPAFGGTTQILPYLSLNDVYTKFDWWRLGALASIPSGFFKAQWADGNGSNGTGSRFPGTGKLTLPSLRGVDYGNAGTGSAGTPFSPMFKLESLSLGGATYETTVTNLDDNAFAGDTKLDELTLHAAADMTVGTNIFGSIYRYYKTTQAGHTPSVMRFTGEAISTEAVSNLLFGVAAVDTAAKPVTIYASKYQTGWWRDSRAEWLSAATADEKAAYPGETVLGVYRENIAAPSGKAVVLHRGNDWDVATEPGLTVIVR